MDIGAILVGLALFIGSVAITLSPFQKKDQGIKKMVSRARIPSIEEQRQRTLGTILDLDFDYNLGKVTPEDYTTLRAGLIQKVAQLSVQAPQEDEIEALIRARREKLEKHSKPLTCPKCGKTLTADDRFCSGCGSSIASKCPGCGKAISAGDLFCSGCGRLLKQPNPSVPQIEAAE